MKFIPPKANAFNNALTYLLTNNTAVCITI